MTSLVERAPLGRGGPLVSPLGLGTAGFGASVPDDAARGLLAYYLDAGGNLVLTSEASETLVGEFLRSSARRGEVILTAGSEGRGPPLCRGEARGARAWIAGALDASLRRLRTDCIDLYWVRPWDGETPAEEVVSIAEDLARAGKIRHLGLADVPAWYLARAKTIAERGGGDRIVGLMMPYSLLNRAVEFELLPAAIALDVGACITGPLAAGFLTGKYRRNGEHAPGARSLLQTFKSHSPLAEVAGEKGWALVDLLVQAAAALGRSPTQVALNWAATRPGVVTTRVRVTSRDQLREDLAALELRIPWLFDDPLERACRPPLVYPYDGFSWDHVRTGLGRPGK